MNTWVRAYSGNHEYYYVNTDDLVNLRVEENSWGPTWSIFATRKDGTGDVPLFGNWTTEDEAAMLLRNLLHGVDLSS